MFSSAWFWMMLAVFFIMGPMRWRRGRWDRWSRSDGDRDEQRERGSRETKESAERLQRRDEQVEQLEVRVAELESRLDFAERLLAPRREPALAPPHQAT